MKTFYDLPEELLDEIKTHIDKNQPEFYWDRNDDLNVDDIELLLEEEGFNELSDKIFENNIDYVTTLEDELIDVCIDEFENKINEQLVCEKDDWEEDFKNFCIDYICVNTKVEDLIRRHNNEVFFYETGLVLEDTTYSSDEDIEESLNSIKNTLSITTNEFDEKIKLMICQANYGGNLVVYFYTDLNKILNLKKEEDKNIRFSGNVSIAIINTDNGSGDETEIKHTFDLPFVKENLYFEKGIKYNFSFAVCGMIHDWCKDTLFEIVETEEIKEIKNNLSSSLSYDKELSKKWRETGKCTMGDIDFTRHKNVEYINDFPCEHRCKDCGTFWID